MVLESGMEGDILKVVPSPEELQIIGHRNQDSWKCPEVGCSYVALNACILGLHRLHVHNFRTKHRKTVENVHYHCPVDGCYFNPQSERYFTNFDTLRTHYMKIHSEKKFNCTKCNKTFGLERDCHRHQTECGQKFHCLDCGKVYTNRSALRGHCNYNRHHSLALEKKAKAVKEPKSKPIKIKRKPPIVAKNTQSFILPKPTSQMHSLHIQTDASGSQYFISKMAPDSSTSQAVQTVNRVSMTRSAGIQTTFEFHPRNSEGSNQTERLSTGIQTVMPNFTSLNDSHCVAQTQTGESVLQKAVTKASIPALNVFKETQKSLVGYKRKKSNVSCTAGSQTFCSETFVKRNHIAYSDSNHLYLQGAVISPDKEAQFELSSSMDFLMSTMSTQTSLSCVSKQIFPKLYKTEREIQLQDCHTQTHSDAVHFGQAAHGLDQNIISRDFVPISDQVTQTKSYYFSSDQNTQTGNMNKSLSGSIPFGFLSIKDNQTQTVHEPLNSGEIQNGQIQTQITSITNSAQAQNQDTTCERLFSLSEGDLSNFSKGELNPNNDSGIDFLLEDKIENPGKCFRSSESTDDLTYMLMEVIDSNISCGNSYSSVKEESKNPRQSTSPEYDSCGNCINAGEKICLTIASMETQTLGNLGMDSMTQTIEDLGWDMSTQTVDYLLTDMMTQTGDDFLEFMTNDTHTQTLDDFCMNFAPGECSRTPDCAGTSKFDSSKEISLQGLFGDHVSTQTIWDTEDQTLDLHSSSFFVPEDTSFEDPAQESDMKPELVLEKEENTSKDFSSHAEKTTTDINVQWESILSSETLLTLSDLGRDTETQTMYDPIFYNLNSEDALSFNSTTTVKYLESSHTQTTQDPMLPSVGTNDDPMSFLNQSIFAQKETSETQTGTDYDFPAGRETAECQTPWDSYLTSVGTSETQTQNADFF